ncbi:hypothetical protein DFP72DRAFT_856358 [Ephemerocybe angulata]|uniref:Uncharacterized protein n=1 Tax=Ephemerocybe angulata TaxID=980116 RepID=A0A8H6HEJ1_9AGAR|nr:hypothetical protein DFP72DRAFT_856358 [Tulosesus angulatus]
MVSGLGLVQITCSRSVMASDLQFTLADRSSTYCFEGIPLRLELEASQGGEREHSVRWGICVPEERICIGKLDETISFCEPHRPTAAFKNENCGGKTSPPDPLPTTKIPHQPTPLASRGISQIRRSPPYALVAGLESVFVLVDLTT